MSDCAISVQGLSKQYRLGTRPRSLRRLLSTALKRDAAPEPDAFWALRDLDFSINAGEVVGIVGRNGAGKSTLLKILSRITPPSKGRAEIHGRVASLLEVGTGFHPELSGRDNIHLNGAILGMSRQEIRSKFDEIVAFAEVERFLDTPVKHYSSGMYVRLAFAVAAHLEPEILVIDEVLAVGDAAFQEKCLGKMDSIARQSGRTILFVSHNTAAVRSLCTRALLLDQGKLTLDASPAEVLERYLSRPDKTGRAADRLLPGASPFVEISSLCLNGHDQVSQALESTHQALEISLEFNVKHPLRASLELRLADRHGSRIALSSPGFEVSGSDLHALSPGRHRLTCRLQLPALVSGTYHLDVLLLEPYVGYFAEFQQAFELHVESSGHTWEKLYEKYDVNMGHMLLPASVTHHSLPPPP